MSRIWAVVVLVALLGGGIATLQSAWGEPAVAAAAAAGEAEGARGVRRMSMLDWINAGGLIGYTIIVLSIVAVALIIEHAVTVRREKVVPPHLVSELEGMFDEQQFDEALALCDAEDCFLTRVVGAGLAKKELGVEAMERAVEEVGDEEATILFHKVGYLSLIVTVAPMMGLLGTVVGMVIAFNVIAQTEGGATPAQLAEGIAMALITTVEGLTVAIPVSVAFAYFRNRVMKLTMEVAGIAGDLLDRFRTTT